MARITKQTTLYTLIVRPDQTFEIKMDGNQVKTGSLLEDFAPSVNPAAEIEDSTDSKPADWVDEARIPDPDATKPADWDEDAPYEIVDENAAIPEDWLEDEPAYIPDPDAQKPEDWDDEEDGDWLPPTVPNPKCTEVSGCGKWEKPMMQNPQFKGIWQAELIDNPDYNGEWAPKKIPNPNYFEDKTPANLEPMGAVGFELWTMSNNILFDNIYIGHSEKDALWLQKKTFDIKQQIEQHEDAPPPPPPVKPKTTPKSFKEDPVAYMVAKFELFFALVQKDPIAAIKAVPEAAGGIAALAFTLFSLIAGLLSMASAPTKIAQPAPKKTEKVAEKKPAVVEKDSSSSEDDKKKASRRTTRKAE